MSDPVPPPEPGEGGSTLRAKALKNRALILQPVSFHQDGKGKDRAGNPTTYEYVKCNVWVLDRAGVETSDSGLQISWWRAREQLRQQMGELVACRPIEEQDNSVVLAPLQGVPREMAEKVVAEIEGGDHAISERGTDEDGSEVF